jgi:predicted ABC-type sugar transport system permease subunit
VRFAVAGNCVLEPIAAVLVLAADLRLAARFQLKRRRVGAKNYIVPN